MNNQENQPHDDDQQQHHASEDLSLDPTDGSSFGAEEATTGEQTPVVLQAALDDANRRLLIAQAEVDNTRKRLRRDYEEQLKYAAMPILRDMLAVLDNLHRALGAAGGAGGSSGLTEGVSMVVKQFEETLQRHHCKPIPAAGEAFDPNFHEAIAQMPSDNVPQGWVADEAVTGYQYHDRVVRPSQVIVSTGPANPN